MNSHLSRFATLCLALAVLTLASCSSTYMKRAEGAHRALHHGDYQRAVKLIEDAKPAQKDMLLYLMDKGMILHVAGQYGESNKVLFEAEELAKGIRSKSVSREVGATLGSEEATEYSGDRHEVVMIPVIRMLNYIMMDDWNGALVEVRRVENLAGDFYGSSKNFDNAFTIYLSAIIWEALGQINDAHIDYKRLAALGKNVPYYPSDLKATAKKLGLSANLPSKISEQFNLPDNYRERGMGELVVIAQSGRSPKFVSEYISDGLVSMAIPVAFVWPDSPAMAEVFVDGKLVGTTYPFHNIADDVLHAMRSRQKRTLVRKVIKTSVQTGLYGASHKLMKSDDSAEQGLGIALGIAGLFMAAAEKADERSWRTLPAYYEIGRFYMKPGKSDVKVVSRPGHTLVSKSVEISTTKPAVILVHVPVAGGVAAKRYSQKGAVSIKASEKEAALSREIRKKPSDGNLKISLAAVKIEEGDYDVEKLISDGLMQGGDKNRGYSLLSVALAVKGDYQLAAKSADRAGLHIYRDTLLFVGGMKKSAPNASLLKSSSSVEIPNGFENFVSGLVAEKKGKNEDACRLFLKSYEEGLIGRLVVRKILAAFGASGESFKKSKEGGAIVDRFADDYLQTM